MSCLSVCLPAPPDAKMCLQLDPCQTQSKLTSESGSSTIQRQWERGGDDDDNDDDDNEQGDG